MILRRLFYALCCTFALSTLSSQDIHYTLHNMAPLQLNPALTGSFYGSVRVGGIYRGQWHGSGGPKTANLFADAPIIRGLRKQDWIGVGFMLTNDKVNAAAVDFITNQTGFSAAYHLGLDKKQTSVLTLGLQYATTNFGFNLNMLGVDAEGNPRPIQEATIPQSLGGLGRTVGEMLGTSTTGGGGNSQDDGPRESFTSINAGLLFKTLLDEKKGNKVEIGFAMIHLNSDDYRSFVNDTIMSDMDPTRVGGDDSAESRERKSTIHAHVNLDYQLSEKLRFLPTLYYQNSAQNSSMSIQAWVGAMMKNDMLFKFGLGYRTGDAGKILLGLEKDRLQVAASYDLQLSQLAPTTNLGSVNSFELAANYIFNIYKKPEVKPNILCPRI